MAEVTLTFIHTAEADGFDQTVSFTRDGIETVEDALQFCLDSHKASGWDYWEAMGVAYDDGTIKWQPSQL